MRSIIIESILRALVAINLLGSLAIAGPLSDRETLFDEIYLNERGPMTPGITLDKLEEYNMIDPDDKQVSRLISLSKYHKDKCGFERVREIRDEIESLYSAQDSTAIKKYKNYQWQKRFEVCKEVWKNDLKTEVDNLSELYRQQIKALKDSIFKNLPKTKNDIMFKKDTSRYDFKNKFLDHNIVNIALSILPYFEGSIGDDAKQVATHEDIYNEHYHEIVEDLCYRVREQLHQPALVYQLFSYDRETNLSDDEFVLDWLENLEVCKVIHRREKIISRVLYKALKQKYPGPGIASARNCFNGHC